jgi:hypothetical protein
MFSPYAFQPNFPFLFFSLLRCVYGMRAPLVNQYTQPSSSLSHIVATWRHTRDLLPCMPTNNPMPCFAGGYKTKSHAPLLPNRSRWLPPPRATPPSTRSRVWDELVIVAIEAQQARGLALSMDYGASPGAGAHRAWGLINFPGEWIDYGGQNCSPSIRLSLSPAPTPPIRSPTTYVALARFAMAATSDFSCTATPTTFVASVYATSLDRDITGGPYCEALDPEPRIGERICSLQDNRRTFKFCWPIGLDASFRPFSWRLNRLRWNGHIRFFL